jgi:cytohesin
VLFAVVGGVLALWGPKLLRVIHERNLQLAFQRAQQAQMDLQDAVRTNDIGKARHALASGANPNMVSGSHLKMCIQHGGVQLIEMLLDADLEPNANWDSFGASPLHTSIEAGQISVTEKLLDLGADMERVDRLENGLTPSGPPLFAAISCRQPTEVRLELARRLIERGAHVSREVSERTAMDYAVRDSLAEIGDVLREHGAEYGPREMVAFNRLDEIKHVVELDAGVLRRRFRPVYAAAPGQGPTLLGIALERGYQKMAQFLIESGAPLDTVEGLGQTLLHMAARGGNRDLIRLLLARGLDIDARDAFDDTPLQDIAGRGTPKAIAALIEAGADVNTRGTNQNTPLITAVKNDRIEIVGLLLAAGADPTLSDRFGNSALDIARGQNAEIAEILEAALSLREGAVPE